MVNGSVLAYELSSRAELDFEDNCGFPSNNSTIEATGEVITIVKTDIKELEQDEGTSVMPEDLTEAMTVKDFQDVQAYLMLQKPEQESQ